MVSVIYDYIKVSNEIQITENIRCLSIFPKKYIKSSYNTIIQDSLRLLANLCTENDQNPFLKCGLAVARSENYISTYLERTSGCMYDAIFIKMMIEIFCGIPQLNNFSTSHDTMGDIQRNLEQLIYDEGLFYTFNDYKEVWWSACFHYPLRDLCR